MWHDLHSTFVQYVIKSNYEVAGVRYVSADNALVNSVHVEVQGLCRCLSPGPRDIPQVGHAALACLHPSVEHCIVLVRNVASTWCMFLIVVGN